MSWKNCFPLNLNQYQRLKKHMTYSLELTSELANLIIENSKKENLLEGLRTPQLREENEDIIKQMKGN